MKNGTILMENRTHKAVKENDSISIYLKGLNVDGQYFTEADRQRNPSWFEDAHLFVIPFSHEDDLVAIFERLNENNRINVAEFKR